MARVDYFDLEEEIATVLQADADLAGVTVLVEEEVFSAEQTPVVQIFLERRDATAGQPLAGGQKTRLRLHFALWCWERSIESIRKAADRRDDLVGKVEIALMKNRTLNGKVAMSFLEGGEMSNTRVPEQKEWVSGGEIRLVADVVASTT